MEIRTICETWTPLFLLETFSDEGKATKFLVFFEIGGLFGGILSGLVIQLLEYRMGKDRSRWIVANLSTCVLLVLAAMIFMDTVRNRVTI